MKKILILGLLLSVCALVGCEKKAGIVKTYKGPQYYCTEIVDKGAFLTLKTTSGQTIRVPKEDVKIIVELTKKEVEDGQKKVPNMWSK
jgi:hypothetical protein